MTRTFRDLEASAQDSEPREGIEFVLPNSFIRVATGVRDRVIGGKIYLAVSSRRDEVGVTSAGDSRSCQISLPMSHALCQRYMASAVPPQKILVNIWRQQGASGLAELVWSGVILSLAPSDNVGKFLVPTLFGQSMERMMPTSTAGKACPRVLYDAGCQVVRADFAIEAVVTHVNSTTITIDALGGKADGWADFGDFEHLPSGERMTIVSQVGLVIVIEASIYGIVVGDHVVVSPGCDHQIDTGCRDKFDNVRNYGGQPALPTTNPHIPNGLGVYVT